jgi:hypothetical protein
MEPNAIRYAAHPCRVSDPRGDRPHRVSTLDERVQRHLAGRVDGGQYLMSRESFHKNGFALVPYVLPDDVKELVAAEVRDLLDRRSVRRDVRFAATGNSPRRMRNVGASEIRERHGTIRELYESPALLGALAAVAGEPVLPCPYEPEQYVITHLERQGDTHGWHWDDYSFGLIFIVDCPPTDLGGFVQTVPNTRWDKADPRVFDQLINNSIRSYALRPGDLYLLRTDTTMHRVHPIEPGATRTIINMAYAAERDLHKDISHETMEDLFHV